MHKYTHVAGNDGESVDALVCLLRACTHLTSLEVESCLLSPTALVSLALASAHNTSIRHVRLGGAELPGLRTAGMLILLAEVRLRVNARFLLYSVLWCTGGGGHI